MRSIWFAMAALALAWPEAIAGTSGDALPPDEPLRVLAQSTAEPVPQPQQPAGPPPAPAQPAQPPAPAQPAQPPAAEQPLATEEPPAADPEAPPGEEAAPEDDVSLGEIPVVETIELTEDMAKRALDVYVVVKEKYKDAALENYENFQDFVDKAPQGKAFEADIKAAGFANVNDWNLAITTLGYAYSGTIDDQSADIKQQIEELKADTEIAQDMRERMIASLNALIPSDNNRKIVSALMADPAYKEKIAQLEAEEE
jgi:pyruvate/2-oxoglutarate dehydrogenase complex dihydrolipoamide acyltransferase (E2) component